MVGSNGKNSTSAWLAKTDNVGELVMAIKRKIKGELEDDELEVVEKCRAETN